jgi:hypothetical protein
MALSPPLYDGSATICAAGIYADNNGRSILVIADDRELSRPLLATLSYTLLF